MSYVEPLDRVRAAWRATGVESAYSWVRAAQQAAAGEDGPDRRIADRFEAPIVLVYRRVEMLDDDHTDARERYLLGDCDPAEVAAAAAELEQAADAAVAVIAEIGRSLAAYLAHRPTGERA